MPVRYSKDPSIDRSLRHSVKDGVAYAIMSGGSETYFSAYALLLKASAPQVAVIASLPQLIGSLGQLLSAWLGHLLRRRRIIMLTGALIQGLSFLPLIVAAVIDVAQPLWWVGGAITLYFAGANIAAPQWTSLMGELVPERKRGRYFGRRTRLTTLTAFLSLAGSGILLHVFDSRGWALSGFVSIFAIAILARLVSVYHLARMREPQQVSAPRSPVFDRQAWGALRRSGAVQFSIYFVLMQFAVGIAAPLFSVYMLRDLQFTYLEFMANTGTAVLVQFLTLNNWGRITDAFGSRLVLVVTGATIPLLPALWILSPSFAWLLFVQVLSGLAWGGFSLSSTNLLFEFVPSAQRASYSALHNFTTAAGVFIGAALGAVLVTQLPAHATLLGSQSVIATPILSVLLVSSAVRMLVAVLLLRRVREARKARRVISPREFVFRVTRFNAFSGLLYEVVTLFRRDDPRREG